MSTKTLQTETTVKPNLIPLAIGILGMLIASTGNLITAMPLTQKWCYFGGAVLLLLSSLLDRQRFFIILQIIILSGTAVAFTHLGALEKAAVPIGISVIAIIYMAVSGMLRDGLTLFGCAGIILLAAGYAVSHPLIYLSGALVLMIFSYLSYRRGVSIAIIWALLNALFSITAAVAVYHLWVLH